MPEYVKWRDSSNGVIEKVDFWTLNWLNLPMVNCFNGKYWERHYVHESNLIPVTQEDYINYQNKAKQ